MYKKNGYEKQSDYVHLCTWFDLKQADVEL